ncbi:helix-turn-helix domain-containing protein [Alicyclobacillus fastidiosus]|uniref:Helix-turn-helix transcriptional regulator n=1 Tax=Alicyclobacillus fastidiosus TaxID=392011 RepID=A0ABV5A9S9_9BACL|nr:helix-turn-helix transcriptional regulator [Alicyclobacillus fastidiosus]WEH10947.1 helix-turn-helix transcriptional regulator [Alicyclobacillus fastidiosus]
MASFGVRLRQLRTKASLTQEELGKQFKISPSTIGMYERDEREPSLELLQRLAEFFEVTIDYLVSGKQPNIDPDLGLDISDLSAEEVEFLNELKEEVAFKDFLKDPEEKKRELIETVKMLMRGRKK